MPRRGYVQSAEHRKKRLKLILGAKNGSFKDGRRSYRRRAGAKPNDGSVVHHKNGDRTVNHRGNLERLTDGDRKPGRRTTPRHEQLTNRTDSIATAVAILREDAKGKKCPGGYWIPRDNKCRSTLAQPKRSFKTGAENEYKPERGAFSHRTERESEMSKRENIAWNAGAAALGVGLAGVGALALMGRTPKKNPYNTPEPVVEPLRVPERVTPSSSPSGVAEARISTPQVTTRPVVTIAPPPPPQEASIAARVAVAQAEESARSPSGLSGETIVSPPPVSPDELRRLSQSKDLRFVTQRLLQGRYNPLQLTERAAEGSIDEDLPEFPGGGGMRWRSASPRVYHSRTNKKKIIANTHSLIPGEKEDLIGVPGRRPKGTTKSSYRKHSRKLSTIPGVNPHKDSLYLATTIALLKGH